MNLIAKLEQEEIERLGKTIPDFSPGDTVVVSVNVVEGERKRVQVRIPSVCWFWRECRQARAGQVEVPFLKIQCFKLVLLILTN